MFAKTENNPSRSNMISMLSLNSKYNKQQLDILTTKDLYDLYHYNKFIESGKRGIILNNDELNIIKKYVYHGAKNQRLQIGIDNNCIYIYLNPSTILMIDVQSLKFQGQTLQIKTAHNYQIEKRALLLLFEAYKTDDFQNKIILFEELFATSQNSQKDELKINIYNADKPNSFYLLLSRADYQQQMFDRYEKQYLGWFLVIYTNINTQKLKKIISREEVQQ